MVQSWPNIGNKLLHCLFIFLHEDSIPSSLVDHLHHPDDRPPDADGHAEHGHGVVTSLNMSYHTCLHSVDLYFFINSRIKPSSQQISAIFTDFPVSETKPAIPSPTNQLNMKFVLVDMRANPTNINLVSLSTTSLSQSFWQGMSTILMIKMIMVLQNFQDYTAYSWFVLFSTRKSEALSALNRFCALFRIWVIRVFTLMVSINIALAWNIWV